MLEVLRRGSSLLIFSSPSLTARIMSAGKRKEEGNNAEPFAATSVLSFHSRHSAAPPSQQSALGFIITDDRTHLVQTSQQPFLEPTQRPRRPPLPKTRLRSSPFQRRISEVPLALGADVEERHPCLSGEKRRQDGDQRLQRGDRRAEARRELTSCRFD